MERFDPAQFTHGFKEMAEILGDAWQKDMVAGFSGNASLRLADGNILLTAAGARKGHLGAQEICLCNNSGTLLAGPKPSSEAPLHFAIYAARPDCRAILHTHPPNLLALALHLGDPLPQNWLALPLYEAEVFGPKLAIVPRLAPGSRDLADAVPDACAPAEISAVWMSGHGLCTFGATLATALGLAEEYEHLARIRLLAGK